MNNYYRPTENQKNRISNDAPKAIGVAVILILLICFCFVAGVAWTVRFICGSCCLAG
jgi:hypothetical protein